MSTDPSPAPPPPPSSGGGWLRPVAIVLASLVIGFVGGWILRGDDGTVTVLETGAQTHTNADGGTGTGTGGTTGGTGTGATTAPSTTAPAPPTRAEIVLAVLNGTNVNGYAGQTATRAEALGYRNVAAGDAPKDTPSSTVYHVRGQQAAARRVARDLEIDAISPLPASGPIVTAANDANPDAQVVVVLGAS